MASTSLRAQAASTTPSHSRLRKTRPTAVAPRSASGADSRSRPTRPSSSAARNHHNSRHPTCLGHRSRSQATRLVASARRSSSLPPTCSARPLLSRKPQRPLLAASAPQLPRRLPRRRRICLVVDLARQRVLHNRRRSEVLLASNQLHQRRHQHQAFQRLVRQRRPLANRTAICR